MDIMLGISNSATRHYLRPAVLGNDLCFSPFLTAGKDIVTLDGLSDHPPVCVYSTYGGNEGRVDCRALAPREGLGVIKSVSNTLLSAMAIPFGVEAVSRTN